MDILLLLLKGCIIGLMIAVPLGALGIICIQRTLIKGRMYGIVSGFGIATADSIQATIVGFGLTRLSDFLITYQRIFDILGSSVLCGIGGIIFFSKLSKECLSINTHDSISLLKAYSSTLLVTISHPVTIIYFGAVFSHPVIIPVTKNHSQMVLLVIGVFIGSIIWWTVLSNIVNILRHKMRLRHLSWMNKISGLSIIIFGFVLLFSSMI